MPLFMNHHDIDEACSVVAARAPEYKPYVDALRAWRDCVNANSDGWAYWGGGIKAAAKLMALTQKLTDSLRGWGMSNAKPPVADFRKALGPIRAAATRHNLPFKVEV